MDGEIPEFVDVQIKFAVGDRGSISGWFSYNRGTEEAPDTAVMMEAIPEDEYDRSGVRVGTVRARIPVARLFDDAIIQATSVEATPNE